MGRVENIVIKLTSEEKQKIKQKAKEEGLPVSTYARYSLLKEGE